MKSVEVTAAVKGVDISHHGVRAVDGGPSVSEKLLGPSAELVTGTGVGCYLLDSVAIANPVEVASLSEL